MAIFSDRIATNVRGRHSSLHVRGEKFLNLELLLMVSISGLWPKIKHRQQEIEGVREERPEIERSQGNSVKQKVYCLKLSDLSVLFDTFQNVRSNGTSKCSGNTFSFDIVRTVLAEKRAVWTGS